MAWNVFLRQNKNEALHLVVHSNVDVSFCKRRVQVLAGLQSQNLSKWQFSFMSKSTQLLGPFHHPLPFSILKEECTKAVQSCSCSKTNQYHCRALMRPSPVFYALCSTKYERSANSARNANAILNVRDWGSQIIFCKNSQYLTHGVMSSVCGCLIFALKWLLRGRCIFLYKVH